jgi:hypothetical protein
MAAQSRQFLAIASDRAVPDRGACALYGGRFSAITHSKTGFGLITAQSRTVRHITNRESWMARRNLTLKQPEKAPRVREDRRGR